MRAVLSSVGMFASLVILLASIFMNYLFLSSLGKTPFEGEVLGAVSAAADVLKSALPFFITWGWRQKKLSIVVPGFLIWVLFAGFSFISAIGFSSQNRFVMRELSHDQSAAKLHLKAEIKRLKSNRDKLVDHRPAVVVKEAIERHKQDRRWQATNKCREATIESSRRFCERFYELRAELALGQKENELDAEIISLNQKILDATKQPSVSGLETQIKALGQIVNLDATKLDIVLTVLIALLVECGASLGPYLSLSHYKKQASNLPQNKPVGLIEDFCLTCLVSEREGLLTEEELFKAYVSWCNREGYTAFEENAFRSAFENLAKEVGIPKENKIYKEIAMVPMV